MKKYAFIYPVFVNVICMVAVTELTVSISLHTSSGMPTTPNTIHVSQYFEKGIIPHQSHTNYIYTQISAINAHVKDSVIVIRERRPVGLGSHRCIVIKPKVYMDGKKMKKC